MFNIFGGNNYLYYASITLQVICVIHCVRKGNQVKWLWIIMLLPVIGCVAYAYVEIVSKSRIKKPAVDLGAVFNPGAKLKKLEDALRFSDTFNNRVQLADACFAAGQTTRAIELYESSLTGAFSENEHVQKQLILAYYEEKQYDQVIAVAKRIKKLPQFNRSKSHIVYALALEKSGQPELAEVEFKAMKGRYSCFEHRCYYGGFLARAGREEEAQHVFEEILEEEPHLSAMERKSNRGWFVKAREELKKIEA